MEKCRKAGRLIGVTLGRRGFGYPACEFAERGTLPNLERILTALREHNAWTRLVFLTSENGALNGRRPLDALCAGEVDEVVAAARMYNEQWRGVMGENGVLCTRPETMKPSDQISQPQGLLQDVRVLIVEARRHATAVVNVGLTLLYWRIGKRVSEEVLGGERAAYGEQIVVTLSR